MRSAARALCLAGFTGLAGCYPAPLALCGEIPAGGCPIGRGGTCDDPTCTGVYDCVDGGWTALEICSANGGAGGAGGGTGGAGAGPGGGGAGGASACDHAVIDHTPETSGCEPPLVDPDCPAVAAEAPCIEDACATGCLDFFLCTQDGWVDVAYCDPEGALVVF